MKSILIVLVALLLIWTACQKEKSNQPGQTKIVADKSTVAAGGTVTVQLLNQPTGTLAKWTVSPNTGVTIDSIYSIEQNSISFSQPGTYEVNADLRLVNPDCRPSPGWDTCYAGGSESSKLSSQITVHN